MHGRLKVKTSAQEQEERRKEREQKLKIYRAGFEAVFHKRKIGDYDEEVLHITKQLLCSNPDIYTLWNVRRESLKLLCETKSQEEYFEEELRVTEAALRSNPKSYGAWHHRMWVLQAMQNPPLTQDLVLCSKLLKADPRNFHCWDYRRWLSICMGSGNKVQLELEFSLDKLTDNFSNYSAWHYRTLFLPVVHMDENAPCSITAIQHKKELELVQNAVFTDPGDQSAWFYLRWLLGKGSACKPQLRMGTLKCSEGRVVSASLVLTVAEKASKRDEKPWLWAQLRIGKCVIKGHWKCSGSLKCSHIWTFTPDPADHEMIVSGGGGEGADVEDKVCDLPSIALIECGEDIDELYLKREVHPGDQSGAEEWVGRREVNETTGWDSDGEHFGKGLVTPLLEEQLELCTQLLDLEPDSRWALLTAVQLMRTLKKRHAQQKVSSYHAKIMDYLDKLKIVDPLRCGFYSDLRSDCILDTALSSSCSSVIDLSSLGLTALPSPLVPLPFPLLMATKIDLSANPLLMLPTLRPGSLACLAHLPRLCHLRLGTSFPKLATEFSMENILPQLPQLLHLELVSDDANASTLIPKVIVNTLYELMPALQSLKPV